MDAIGKMDCPPVLLILFNRPDTTQKVFKRIREVQPSQLFVAADGPRPERSDEIALCAETRKVVEKVDWPCNLHILFRDENLGCKIGVSSAITWFFEHVESGIILEDDCIPHPTFFRFCAELLEHYHKDDRIVGIGGNNFQQGKRHTRDSYYFSKYLHIWGWATWRRSWKYYDGNLTGWQDLRNTSWLLDALGNEREARYWRENFDRVYAAKIDTWDYAWTYSYWRHSSLAIVPEMNLVSNIGFDSRAMHTQVPFYRVSNLPVKAMKFPLKHPSSVVRNMSADHFTFERIFNLSPRKSLPVHKRAIYRVFSKLPPSLKRFLDPIFGWV
jgi:hypothetical protein